MTHPGPAVYLSDHTAPSSAAAITMHTMKETQTTKKHAEPWSVSGAPKEQNGLTFEKRCHGEKPALREWEIILS